MVPVVPAGSDAMCETKAYHGAKARHSVGDQARAAPSRLYEEQTLWGLFSLGFAAARPHTSESYTLCALLIILFNYVVALSVENRADRSAR